MFVLGGEVGSVGLFCNFAAGRWGLASRDVLVSCSMMGTPTVTGAEDPLNHELSPPLLSAILITPSLSPVRVGMKSPSMSTLVGLSESVELVRNGNNAVNERWCVRGCLAGYDSSSADNGTLIGKGLDVSVAAGGGDGISKSSSPEFGPPISSE